MVTTLIGWQTCWILSWLGGAAQDRWWSDLGEPAVKAVKTRWQTKYCMILHDIAILPSPEMTRKWQDMTLPSCCQPQNPETPSCFLIDSATLHDLNLSAPFGSVKTTSASANYATPSVALSKSHTILQTLHSCVHPIWSCHHALSDFPDKQLETYRNLTSGKCLQGGSGASIARRVASRCNCL